MSCFGNLDSFLFAVMLNQLLLSILGLKLVKTWKKLRENVIFTSFFSRFYSFQTQNGE